MDKFLGRHKLPNLTQEKKTSSLNIYQVNSLNTSELCHREKSIGPDDLTVEFHHIFKE